MILIFCGKVIGKYGSYKLLIISIENPNFLPGVIIILDDECLMKFIALCILLASDMFYEGYKKLTHSPFSINFAVRPQ